MKSRRLDTKISTCWINVNRACNLRCSWCYAQGTNYKGNAISLQDAVKIVDIFSEYGTKNFIILGGEPTLYAYLPELLKYIKDSEGRATVVTNALKLADIDYLQELKIQGLQGLSVSLKAPNRESFKKTQVLIALIRLILR